MRGKRRTTEAPPGWSAVPPRSEGGSVRRTLPAPPASARGVNPVCEILSCALLARGRAVPPAGCRHCLCV